MPTVARFNGISIRMYFNDHVPPHFHARYNEFEGVYTIVGLKPIGGKLPPPQEQDVMEWAATNEAQELLWQTWNDLHK